MSLHVYLDKKDIPAGLSLIRENDVFFNGMTCLQNDDVTCRILHDIDDAVYNSKDTIIGKKRSLGALNKSYLSTGAKTILNVKEHPERCFSLLECGNNALKLLHLLTEGHVFLDGRLCISGKRFSCDIEFGGKLYTDFIEFTGGVITAMNGEE